jgi:preprotein translocase subunit SecE
VARNRKRAKERRARQPQPVVGRTNGAPEDEAPNPIEHAAPDVELAEAQLALGRPELADVQPASESGVDDVDELDDEEFEDLEDDVDAAAAGGGGGAGSDDGAMVAESARPEPSAHPPAAHATPGSRLLNFLQGSWRELQRVQWPDRRQVIQATSVVIGFVIVAGVFLGVADFLSGHLMNYILEGHW